MDLIPKSWNITARTIKDVISFGKITICEMICWWLYIVNGLTLTIIDTKQKLKLLKDKGAVDIRQIAKQYENPKFQINDGGGDPEPTDKASINRGPGTTTFNICGWCKYATLGTGRYNYMINTSCNLKTSAGLRDGERHFNTICFLKEAPDEVFDKIRKGLENKLRQLIEENRMANRKIKLLRTLEKRAEKKPAMPDHRPHGWFNVDDPVVCYIGQWKERIVQNDFTTAKVIMGYRHHDGCVSVHYDKRIHTGDYLDGHGGGYGMSRPEIMHAWEYEYLRKHPDFANLWAKSGTSRYLEGFNAEKFLEALVEEATKVA